MCVCVFFFLPLALFLATRLLQPAANESTVVTAPDQRRVRSFESPQRCCKREAASAAAAASDGGLLLYLNTCLRWLRRVIEGQSERGHLEPCPWQASRVMKGTGKGDGQ